MDLNLDDPKEWTCQRLNETAKTIDKAFWRKYRDKIFLMHKPQLAALHYPLTQMEESKFSDELCYWYDLRVRNYDIDERLRRIWAQQSQQKKWRQAHRNNQVRKTTGQKKETPRNQTKPSLTSRMFDCLTFWPRKKSSQLTSSDQEVLQNSKSQVPGLSEDDNTRLLEPVNEALLIALSSKAKDS